MLTAIYDDHQHIEFKVEPGEVVGNNYEYEGKHPRYFITPKGLPDEDKNYLKDYSTVGKLFPRKRA